MVGAALRQSHLSSLATVSGSDGAGSGGGDPVYGAGGVRGGDGGTRPASGKAGKSRRRPT